MITKEDIERAQQAWGEGIVSISAAHSSGADYIQRATTHIESLYAYGISPVLFKPTFANEKQFRSTFEGVGKLSCERHPLQNEGPIRIKMKHFILVNMMI